MIKSYMHWENHSVEQVLICTVVNKLFDWPKEFLVDATGNISNSVSLLQQKFARIQTRILSDSTFLMYSQIIVRMLLLAKFCPSISNILISPSNANIFEK